MTIGAAIQITELLRFKKPYYVVFRMWNMLFLVLMLKGEALLIKLTCNLKF